MAAAEDSLSSRLKRVSFKGANGAQTREYGLHTLAAKDSRTAGVTDLIAIHGLNGHYEKTWTDEVSQYSWLRDAFSGQAGSTTSSKVSSMVRVLSFSYNSKIQFSKSTAEILDFSNQLLECILAERTTSEEQRRPIVFICHSLGGIIFKQAFNVAATQDRYKDLHKLITGVMFFATPHKGSAIVRYASKMGDLLKASSFGRHTNTQLLKSLEYHSPVLQQISDTFLQLGGKLRIVTLYETNKIDGMPDLVVDRESAILHMGEDISIPLERDHRNICKFTSRSDKMLTLVLSNLSSLVNRTSKLKALDEKLILLERLATSNPDLHKARNPEPAPGTCKWILKHETYTRWFESSTPGLLWLSADPGCGKSVLTSFLIDHLKDSQALSAPKNICYFFFKADNSEQNNALHGLQALLYQLLQQQRELIDVVLKRLPEQQINNVQQLWHALVEALSKSEEGSEGPRDTGQTIILLDGFDECEPRSRRQLAETLSKHFSPKSNSKIVPQNLKIIITSRPENSIKAAFDRPASHAYGPQRPSKNYSMIRLRGEDEVDSIGHNIGIVIDAEISEVMDMGLPEELLHDFRRELVARADRTFLWVTLIIQLLKEKAEAGASQRELNEILLNRDIDAIYAGLLADRATNPKARKLLNLVLAATRPLSVEELSIALAVTPEFDTFKDNGKRRKPSRYCFGDIEQDLVYPFENHIKALCGHFIRIIQNKIYFVHETAREFLLEDETKSSTNLKEEEWFALEDADEMTLYSEVVDTGTFVAAEPSNTKTCWEASMNITQCHAMFLEICVTYIYCMGKQDGCHILGQPSQRAAPFLDYAASAWMVHFSHIRDELDPSAFPYYQNLCHPRFPGFEAWIEAHIYASDQDILANPGGGEDDVQDYFVALFNIDPENNQRFREMTAKESRSYRLERFQSGNPATVQNNYFPISADSNGWVALDLRGAHEDALSNPWVD